MATFRILVVEDEAIIARDIRKRLQKMSYEVTALSHTGQDAIRSADQSPPDMALIDIRLKGDMDGIEVAQHLRHRWHIPVVFITALSDAATLGRAAQTYPHGYLCKPFEDNELRIAIELARDRFLMEDTLRDSERRYRQHFENIADVLVCFDDELRIRDISPSVQKILGFAPHELIGKTLSESGVLTAQSLEQGNTNFKDFLSGEGTYPALYQFVHKDGSHRWGELNNSPIVEEGKRTTYVTIFRDVTQRVKAERALRESEARLKAIFTNMDDYICLYDKDGICIEANNYDRLSPMGYTREEVIGGNLSRFNVNPSGSSQTVDEWHRQVIEEGKSQSPLVFEGVHRDGSRHFFELGVQVLQNDDADIIGSIFNVRDITERKEMEHKLINFNEELHAKNKALERAKDQLRQRSQQLEQVNAELAQYTETVAHDMFAPLRSIRFYTHRLRKELGNISTASNTSVQLDNIDQAVAMSDSMAKQMLKLSRIGQAELRLCRVDTGDLIRDVVSLIQLDGEVEWVISDGWPIIQSDPTLLHQAFQNLIDNAVKFNTSCPKHIELNWTKQGDDHYVFHVIDNGIGISSQDRKNIFQPLKKFAAGVDDQGAGMGLAIIQKAVNRLGGSVSVQSQPGRGSRFTVTIPANPVDDPK